MEVAMVNYNSLFRKFSFILAFSCGFSQDPVMAMEALTSVSSTLATTSVAEQTAVRQTTAKKSTTAGYTQYCKVFLAQYKKLLIFAGLATLSVVRASALPILQEKSSNQNDQADATQDATYFLEKKLQFYMSAGHIARETDSIDHAYVANSLGPIIQHDACRFLRRDVMVCCQFITNFNASCVLLQQIPEVTSNQGMLILGKPIQINLCSFIDHNYSINRDNIKQDGKIIYQMSTHKRHINLDSQEAILKTFSDHTLLLDGVVNSLNNGKIRPKLGVSDILYNSFIPLNEQDQIIVVNAKTTFFNKDITTEQLSALLAHEATHWMQFKRSSFLRKTPYEIYKTKVTKHHTTSLCTPDFAKKCQQYDECNYEQNADLVAGFVTNPFEMIGLLMNIAEQESLEITSELLRNITSLKSTHNSVMKIGMDDHPSLLLRVAMQLKLYEAASFLFYNS